MSRYNIDTDEVKQILNRYYDVSMEELNKMDSRELSEVSRIFKLEGKLPL